MNNSSRCIAVATVFVAITLASTLLLNARDQQIDPRVVPCYKSRDDCGKACDNAYGTGPGHQQCAEQCYKAWMECCNKAVATKPSSTKPTPRIPDHIQNAPWISDRARISTGSNSKASPPKQSPSSTPTPTPKRTGRKG